ncbi:hypothetical protein B9Q01_08715 [Candidatus Marsarchaeota G1 archaeon OSP_D]|uniref:Creatinase N-terminal domain-containing protein n=4 Tax=Candidatus Marsarchaeota TaxID=1978152 RepID=A0A2R6A735_9ARCH|nr:MAG: hypothetical protein B9Q01_08715 [Candidatus Marsarchaeota G1 archaeon OSP_D]PSN87079.1 MAG: hypothetical protein B9Q00_09800 [Candidatus Marsarchaeota G1 archaeon OSP_C]
MHKLPDSEFEQRLSKLDNFMEKQRLDAVYMSGSTNLKYFVRLYYLPTERPAAVVVTRKRDTVFLGPLIEKEHIPYQTKLISKIFTYQDYPGEIHPMKLFARWLEELGLSGKRIGVDNPSFYSSSWGYRGPPLSDFIFSHQRPRP